MFLQAAEKDLAENPGDVHAVRVRDAALEDNAKLLEKHGWTVESGVIYDRSRRVIAGDSDGGNAAPAASSSQEKQPAVLPPTSDDRYGTGAYRRYSGSLYYDDWYYNSGYYDDWYYTNGYYDDWYYYGYADDYSGTEVRRVILSRNDAIMSWGTTMYLSATVLPYTAYDRSLTWWSSDTSVLTVNSYGLVRAVGTGQATVYVRAANGVGGACRVTVY